jgi:hypothetical protein
MQNLAQRIALSHPVSHLCFYASILCFTAKLLSVSQECEDNGTGNSLTRKVLLLWRSCNCSTALCIRFALVLQGRNPPIGVILPSMSQLVMMMMMIIHPVRHGRPDNTMEGRITTKPTYGVISSSSPTTSGMQKRAGQSKAEGISKPNIARNIPVNHVRLPSKARKRHPVNAYWGSITFRHGRKGTWMQTDMKRSSGPTSFPALAGTGRLCRAKSCKADQKKEALERAFCTADPCLGGI